MFSKRVNRTQYPEAEGMQIGGVLKQIEGIGHTVVMRGVGRPCPPEAGSG